MEKYDLVVIGAGPSGYAAAMRALDFKKKTLLIERNEVGGAGVTNGALSSKTWWELSREASTFTKNLKRYNLQAPAYNYKDIQDEVKKAVAERKGMLEDVGGQLEAPGQGLRKLRRHDSGLDVGMRNGRTSSLEEDVLVRIRVQDRRVARERHLGR